MTGIRTPIALSGLVLLVPLAVAAAQDQVTYYDRKLRKDETLTGTIVSESPGQVLVKPVAGAGARGVPSADIVDVFYELPGRLRPDYRQARLEEKNSDTATGAADRKSALEQALTGYQKLLRELSADKQKFAQRHLQFKVARLQARLAEEDPAAADAAIQALLHFKKEHADGWQISSCAKLLARLQLDKGDVEGALRTYADLAALPGISKETRQESDLLAARALIRGKQVALAEKRLRGVLQSLSPDDPQAVRTRIHLAECLGVSDKLDEAVRQLEEIIAKTADPELKALAYNTLGDCYRHHNRLKDALWPYLWVDVIYHQDKREHARAVEQLARLFDELGDKTRAKQYQEKLRGIR